MIFLALALAAPPQGVDPDDFTVWEAAADRALDGPPGCWDFTGGIRVDGAMHSAATGWFRGDTFKVMGIGTWTGRVVDGSWQRFGYVWQELSGADLDVPVFPLIGTISPNVVFNDTPADVREAVSEGVTLDLKSTDDDGDGPTQAINVFHEVVDSWEPAGSTTVSEWSDELAAIRLMQDIPLLKKVNSPVVAVTSIFPGGQEHPTSIDAVFPKRIQTGSWPAKVTLMDTHFHLRQQPVGEHVLPQAEGFTMTAGVLGFTFGYEQQLTYATAQRCVP
jgi:hypothetical protein